MVLLAALLFSSGWMGNPGPPHLVTTTLVSVSLSFLFLFSPSSPFSSFSSLDRALFHAPLPLFHILPFTYVLCNNLFIVLSISSSNAIYTLCHISLAFARLGGTKLPILVMSEDNGKKQ